MDPLYVPKSDPNYGSPVLNVAYIGVSMGL